MLEWIEDAKDMKNLGLDNLSKRISQLERPLLIFCQYCGIAMESRGEIVTYKGKEICPDCYKEKETELPLLTKEWVRKNLLMNEADEHLLKYFPEYHWGMQEIRGEWLDETTEVDWRKLTHTGYENKQRCHYCGVKYLPEERYCVGCGAPL